MPAAVAFQPDLSFESTIHRATEIRHDLHRHPELGYMENYTSGVVQAELTRLGIPFCAGLAGGTGVLATVQGHAGSGKCVALRADMDALPITETTGLPYQSQNPGVMHACGHDGHTAILLGAAALLKAMASELHGTVQLLFQPAEEGGCGALRMVREGVLEKPKVDAIFGLHGWPGLKIGTAATRPGPLLASVDGFTIRMIGKGSHAAAPQDGVDPIIAGAALVQALQAIASREMDSAEACIVTVGQFHAGSTFNVIPDVAELNGTVRALSASRRTAIVAAIERISRGIAAAHRCTVEFQYFGTTPCTNNTPAMAELVRRAGEEILGADYFFTMPKPAMWGEDFSFYLERVPGCFFVLGVMPADAVTYPMLHNSNFNFSDEAIPYGIRMMSAAARRFLES